MKTKIGLAAFAAGMLLAVAALADSDAPRSGYSYVREVNGDVTVQSKWNGRVDARRNMPITAGDEIVVSDSARAEIGLADGNILHISGRTTARFDSLYAQQGENDDFSSIKLEEGSVILSAVGSNEDQIPRIDTDDATVYVSPGSRVRVNVDPRRGTVVIARAGSAELRTREGSSTLRAGQYAIVQNGQEPEIERGSFSRDRFDLWAADRLESLYETRSASAQYVEPEYQSDVQALDGYGDWSYDDTYGTNVWTPRVSADWSPYSYGSWYYTPVGLTWWSFDPWGWFPFHYGNWFFNVSFSRWCWTPAYVYSPAWVYWGYTPSYVGWCPIGYYSFYSPWYHNYYRSWGWDRPGLYVSIRGAFDTRQIDFRAWNFVGSRSFTTVQRMQVIPGSRIGSQVGAQLAVSSRPIVVDPRGTSPRQAIQSYIRQAPTLIQRTATADSSRLAPILARQQTLPPATVQALRERTVVADRGRLTGPSVAEIAPRGALVNRAPAARLEGRRAPTTLERGRPGVDTGGRSVVDGRPGSPSREIGPRPGAPSREVVPRGSAAERPDARVIAPAPRSAAPAPRSEDWRSRGRAEALPVPRENPRPERFDRPSARPERIEPQARPERAPSDWRARPAPQSRAPEAAPPPAAESWRSRSEVPPARRVIDGAVPGRRAEGAPASDWRSREVPRREARPDYATAPRSERYAPAPRAERYAPAPRSERYAPAPRSERPAYVPPARPERFAPAPRSERPAYVAPARPERYAPAPRAERPAYVAPPRSERPAYSAPPRAERAPAYSAPPRAEHHAPAQPHGSPPDRTRR